MNTDFPASNDDYGYLWGADPKHTWMFISHRAEYKGQVANLAEFLGAYNVSCFVAHEHIQVNKEWQKEIEKALNSMEVFLAFITNDFFASEWTNQEIGFALAKGVPIISVKWENCDPKGFIAEKQALNANQYNMSDLADRIFDILVKDPNVPKAQNSVNYKLRDSAVKVFCDARSFPDAEKLFIRLEEFKGFTETQIDKMFDAWNKNYEIYNCFYLNNYDRFLNFISQHSNKWDFEMYEDENGRKKLVRSPKPEQNDDEGPF